MGEVRQLQRTPLGFRDLLASGRSRWMSRAFRASLNSTTSCILGIQQQAVSQVDVEGEDNFFGGPWRITVRSLVKDGVAKLLEHADDACRSPREVRPWTAVRRGNLQIASTAMAFKSYRLPSSDDVQAPGFAEVVLGEECLPVDGIELPHCRIRCVDR